MLFNQSEKIENVAEAIANAYSELTNAITDAKGAFKNDYASLGTVVSNGNRQVLGRNGLAIIQGLHHASRLTKEVTTENGTESHYEPFWQLLTRLQHKSGEFIEFPTPLPIESGGKMSAPHAFMSAVTYMRRCSNGLITNTATDNDDDGNAASNIKDLMGGSQKAPSKKSTPKKGTQKNSVKNSGGDGSLNSHEIALPKPENIGEPVQANDIQDLMSKLSNKHWRDVAEYTDHIRGHWDTYKEIAQDTERLINLTTDLRAVIMESEVSNPYAEIA